MLADLSVVCRWQDAWDMLEVKVGTLSDKMRRACRAQLNRIIEQPSYSQLLKSIHNWSLNYRQTQPHELSCGSAHATASASCMIASCPLYTSLGPEPFSHVSFGRDDRWAENMRSSMEDESAIAESIMRSSMIREELEEKVRRHVPCGFAGHPRLRPTAIYAFLMACSTR